MRLFVDNRIHDLAPLAMLNFIGFLLTTMSICNGAVAFTHVIKACEPVSTVLISRMVYGKRYTKTLYLSLGERIS